MTNRQRFHAAMSFEETDRLCHMEHGFWEGLLLRWKNEGMPEDIIYPDPEHLNKNKIDMYQYVNVIRYVRVMKSEQLFYPEFEHKIIEETEDYRIERNEIGILQKVGKCIVSIPQFLDYPIHGKEDYINFRDRLTGNVEKRYPDEWNKDVKEMREQTHATLSTYVYGFFGYLRVLMGDEKLMLMYYDDPDLIKSILKDRVDFLLKFLIKQIEDIKPDFMFIWEDLCYKNGPLISPEVFREFMLPCYKRLTSFAKEMGVKHIIVDSDGDVLKLIPLWLEGGVTGLLPFEVAAGMDIIKIAELYPKLQIIGGIDKREVAKGKEAIDSELNRVLPYMKKRGGFCVALDHWVPEDISLENYKYFAEKAREFK